MNHLLIILFLTFFSASSNSVVLIEVVNEDREYIPTVIEIYDKSKSDSLVSQLETSTAIRTSLNRANYEIRLTTCEQEYYVKTKIFKTKHHLVFVLDDQNCQKQKPLSM